MLDPLSFRSRVKSLCPNVCATCCKREAEEINFIMKEARLHQIHIEFVGHLFTQLEQWRGFWERTPQPTEARIFVWTYVGDFLHVRAIENPGLRTTELLQKPAWVGSEGEAAVLTQLVADYAAGNLIPEFTTLNGYRVRNRAQQPTDPTWKPKAKA